MLDFVRELPKTIEILELTSEFYDGAAWVGILAENVYAIWYGRKLGLSLWKTVASMLMASVLVVLAMALLQSIISAVFDESLGIMNSLLNNIGRTFVLVPLIAWLIAITIKVPWKKICGIYAVAQPIVWGTASIGCLFSGCCRGYACSWGIYNVMTHGYVFPTQLINVLALWSIAVFLHLRMKKRGYQLDGSEYPIMLILVGLTRFLTEFIMENQKIVFGLSSLSFDSLVMCIVGTVMFLVIHFKGKKQLQAHETLAE